MELPTISIITPCLNAVESIDEALDSVRTQDYPAFEHVVIDGGSTDGTLEKLEGADGIRYVSEPDRGRAHAANKGVAMTSGDVVAWLNADDRYEPGALRAIAEGLAGSPDAAWATGYCRIIDGAGTEHRRFVTEYKKLLLRHYSLQLYITQNFVADPATFVRRSALDQVGLLDERYRMSHDYDLWLRVARLSDPVVLRRYVASFRMVEGTLSMSGFERQFKEHAQCAQRRAGDHRVAVAVNAVASRSIVAIYRLIRLLRRARSR